MTLHDILNILTRPEYADALAKIFLKDDGEEDTKEGGESDA
jgi:hypothetical protein